MDVDDLYALPLTEFVAARGVLSKQLKAAGDTEAAAEVAALRKPSVAAWAVNQVVRASGDGLAGLVEAGDAVAEAQAALVGGGDRAAMRDATKALRTVIGSLVDTAAALDGVGGGAVEHVRETFQAAAVDPQAREAVLGGRLERELRYSGIGVGAGGSTTPARPAPKAKSAPQPDVEAAPERRVASEPDAASAPKARGASKPARRKAEGRSHDEGDGGRSAAAERKAEEARKAAAAAEHERERARERAAARVEAAKALKAAERALDAARRAVGKARDRHERAAAALAEAEDRLTTAQAAVETAESGRAQAAAELDRLGDRG